MKTFAIFFACLIVSLSGQYVAPGVYPPRFFQPAPLLAARIIPRPVFAAAPIVAAAPVIAAAPVLAAPIIQRPVVAAAPFIPAYAPFARTAYLIGSNKGKTLKKD